MTFLPREMFSQPGTLDCETGRGGGEIMTPELQDDELLRSYLLGKLPDEDADRLERRLLADDDLFDLAEAVELDLLAAVDRGAFSSAEREQILHKLAASPRGRERLAFARSLNALATESRKVKSFVRPAPAFTPPAIRWIALAASLVILAGLGWFALEQGPQASKAISQLGGPTPAVMPQLHAPGAPPVGPPPATPIPTKTPRPISEHPAAQKVPTAVLTLSFLTSRGAEERQRLELAPNIHKVEIQIDADGLEDAKSFDLVVRNQDHGTVLEKKGLAIGSLSWGRGLVLDVAAQRLPAGRYEIAITPQGGEELSQEFDVVKGKR
ncbi:MAG TPA: hypothetical protein VLX28_25920 [Thermoanaerobaculia bacterium]|nr:hypothetical protein [Thermoanaerobaculia bacterium]